MSMRMGGYRTAHRMCKSHPGSFHRSFGTTCPFCFQEIYPTGDNIYAPNGSGSGENEMHVLVDCPYWQQHRVRALSLTKTAMRKHGVLKGILRRLNSKELPEPWTVCAKPHFRGMLVSYRFGPPTALAVIYGLWTMVFLQIIDPIRRRVLYHLGRPAHVKGPRRALSRFFIVASSRSSASSSRKSKKRAPLRPHLRPQPDSFVVTRSRALRRRHRDGSRLSIRPTSTQVDSSGDDPARRPIPRLRLRLRPPPGSGGDGGAT